MNTPNNNILDTGDIEVVGLPIYSCIHMKEKGVCK